MMRRTRNHLLAAALTALVVPAPAVSADPPPWAPAHGWRDRQPGNGKGHRKHADERGDVHSRGYEQVGEAVGIPRGACHREVLGALIGGAVGGALGSRLGKGDGQLAATAAGTVIGYIVGAAIGRSMDDVDQACVGQVLERAADQQTVAWTDDGQGARYELTPTRTYERDGRYCRDYRLYGLIGGAPRESMGSACRDAQGRWERLD